MTNISHIRIMLRTEGVRIVAGNETTHGVISPVVTEIAPDEDCNNDND
jgi:hypothetical protein